MNRGLMFRNVSKFADPILTKTVTTFALLLLMLLALSCGKEEKPESKQISYPAETAKMVSAVTSGIISPDSPIKVRFVDPVVGDNLAGASLTKQVFSFSPHLDGITKWEDTRTLVFQPNQPLSMRAKYIGQLDMNLLLPASKDKKLQPLEIAFEVSGREVSTVSGDFEPVNGNRPDEVIYQGSVSFTQPADSENVKKAVKLTMDGKTVPLTIHARPGNETFSFASQVIKRNDKRMQLSFSILKGPLDLSANYHKAISLEPLQEMKVTGIVNKELGNEPVIQIDFSDDLDPEQNLSGLIGIDPPQAINLKISGKTVYVMGKFSNGENHKILVHPGIRSKWGTKTRQETSKEIAFEDIKPQIKFVSGGAFLPTSNQDKIAFQTVNLQRVHLEIMKVFDSNVGQFLQSQKLSSGEDRNEAFPDWEMRRVGINIVNDTLEIGDTRNEWLQSELDLRKILENDEKGLYIITLEFQKKDILYHFREDDESESNRRYGYYYGENYYSNPASPGYYYRHGRIYKAVILSDIGLSYLQGYRQHIVYATNISDAKPMPGIDIQLRTYQNQIIARQTTDGDGKAVFEDISQDVFYVQGKKDGQRSIVKLNEMSWNMSAFDVGGAELPPGGTRAFIYTERGVYRPGDTLHISLIARNEDNTFPENHPVTLKIYNPKNQLVFEKTGKTAKDGFYTFEFSTAPEDMTGNYKAEFLVGTQIFYHTLKIETVVPYRLKVTLEPRKKKLEPDDKLLDINLTAAYLFGNPAAGLRAEVTVKLDNLDQHFSHYPGYTFSNQAMEYKPVESTIFDGDLNMEGKANIVWQLPSFKNVPSAIQARVNARVYEKGGRATESDIDIPIDTYNYYVGLEKPKFKYGYVEVGSPVTVNTILVNTGGEAVAGQSLEYRIYKNNRYWWWEYGSLQDYHLRYKSDSNTELVDKGTIVSQPTPAAIKFKPQDRGQYLIEVQAENGSGHTAGFFFNAYYWGESPGGKEAGAITLKSDKQEYHPGEVAVVTFPTPKEGSILVGVEKASRIISTRWMKPAQNKSETRVEIPVTAEMLPTAYVTVSIIQPHSQTLNDRPIRMYGAIPLNVVEANTRQEIQIKTADELKSGKPFDVEIQTADQKPTQFTIAVVDEGLLALTDFRTPDPWNEFFKKLRLGVKIYDLFSEVIGANKGDIF
ncbi:MAG: MG2 domain-containing protein, partial [Calditrichia bacterium]